MNPLTRLLQPTVPEPLSPGRPPHAMERAEERIDYPAEPDYPTTPEDFEAEREDVYHDPDESPAVRVYPVAAPPRDRVQVTWEAGTVDVDTQDTKRVVLIAAPHRNRLKLTVENLSIGSNVFLVKTRETLYFLGRKLNAGKSIEMTHTDAVWVFVEAGADPCTITWHAEYEVPEEDASNG